MISGIPTNRNELEKIYATLKPKWFRQNPFCCVSGCGRKTDDLHHTRGRNGLLLATAEFFVPLCRPHHNRLKEPGGVEWGRQHGLLPEMGGHNTLPEDVRKRYLGAFLALNGHLAIRDWILDNYRRHQL
jgi:hypothetical protein